MKTHYLVKNVNLFLSIFFLAFIIFTFVRCSPPTPVEGTPEDDSYQQKLISHEDAQILFDEYTKTNHEVLTRSRNGQPDSRWYSFTIEEMEGYIKYVKENAAKQGLKDVGIKIYMGKYPVNHPANKMAKPEFAGYQTIFLMPTSKKQNTENTRSATSSDESEKIESIQPMNMTNLSPPPNQVSSNTLN